MYMKLYLVVKSNINFVKIIIDHNVINFGTMFSLNSKSWANFFWNKKSSLTFLYVLLGLSNSRQLFYLDMKTQYLILGYFCAHLQKPTKAKISGKKNSTRPNPSTWNQKSCRTKWFGNPRIHIAEEDKKVDDEDSRKLNTTKQKNKRRNSNKAHKDKKRVLKYLFAWLYLCIVYFNDSD